MNVNTPKSRKQIPVDRLLHHFYEVVHRVLEKARQFKQLKSAASAKGKRVNGFSPTAEFAIGGAAVWQVSTNAYNRDATTDLLLSKNTTNVLWTRPEPAHTFNVF